MISPKILNLKFIKNVFLQFSIDLRKIDDCKNYEEKPFTLSEENSLSDSIIQSRYDVYYEYLISDFITNIMSYSDEENKDEIIKNILKEWKQKIKYKKINDKADLIKFIKPLIEKEKKYNFCRI
jgi:hypothetical protein